MNEAIVEVRERSSTPILPQHYRQLEREPQFWALVEAGIVALERSRLSRYALKAGPYVGQAIVGELVVRVREKIDGALSPLLLFPDQPDVRIIECESFADRIGLVLRSLIDKYLDLLDSYLRAGRMKVYQRTLGCSALPRGKVSVAQTIRRWAAGRRDQIVFSLDQLSPKTLLNQLIGFSLHVIDGIIRVNQGEIERLKRIRTSAMLFEDSGWQSLIRTPRDLIEQRYVSDGYADSPVAGLASLARLFSLHFGAATSATEERLKYSWFVNLETLFEECVRRSAALSATARGLAVTDWKVRRHYVFEAEHKYRAQPDLVVWRGASPIAILDAKYKDPDALPSNADLYQLAVHAEAWKVRRTALVYPATANASRRLGVTALNIAVDSMTLDVLHPLIGGEALMDVVAAGMTEKVKIADVATVVPHAVVAPTHHG